MTDIVELGFRVDTRELVAADKALDNLDRSGKSVTTTNRSLGTSFGGMAAAVGALGLGALASSAMDSYRSFESMSASLKTVTGSTENASAAFAKIEEFATTTPYNLEQAVQGFIKLKSLGLDPSMDALNSYGNTASAMGKDLNQMIEAVADASTMEFERLKEFGIKAKQEGDNVTFTFQGVSTTVKKEAGAIEGYLQNIGNVQFAGAMSDQMQTLNGAISNMEDNYAKFTRTLIEQTGAGDLYKQVIIGISEAIESATAFVVSASDTWRQFKFALEFSDESTFVVLRNIGDAIQKIGGYLSPVIPYLDDFALAVGGLAVGAGIVAGIGFAFGIITSPITIAAAAVVLFANGAKAVYDNWSGIVTWWNDTPLDDKVLSVDLALLDFAKSTADSFFGWWNESTLKDHAPQIVVDAVAKAEELSRTFFNWWNSNDLQSRIADVDVSPIDLARSIGTGFVNWWNSVSIDERSLLIDTAATQIAETAVRGFAKFWNENPFVPQSLQIDTDTIEKAETALATFISTVAEGWAGLIDVIVSTDIGGAIARIWSDVSAAASRAFGDIVDGVQVAFDDISEIVGEVKLTFTSLFDGQDGIAKIFKDGWNLLASIVDIGWDLITVSLKAGWGLVTGVIKAGLLALRGDFSEGWDAITDTIVQFGADLVSGIKQIIPKMAAAGANMMSSFGDSLKSKMRGLFGIGVEAVDAVADGVTTRAQIQSPSKLFEGYGIFIGEGLAQGIKKSMSSVKNATTDIVEVIEASVQSMMDALERQGYAFDDVSPAAMRYKLTQELAAEATDKGADAAVAAARRFLDYSEAIEEVNDEINAQARAQKLQNIELTDGSFAARVAGLEMDKYTTAQAENYAKTEANMEMQREFHTTLKNSIMNASSVKDVFNDIGDFMKDWLKEKIATFAANKIMLAIGLDGGGGLTGGGLFDGLQTALGFLSGSSGSAAESIGVLASDMNTTKDLMGGMGTATRAAGSSFGVLASDANAASTAAQGAAAGFAASAITIVGAAYAAYEAGQFFVSQFADGLQENMEIGYYLGGWTGAVVAGALGTSFKQVSEGFQLSFENGALSGQSFDYFEKERSMFRGTAQQWVFSELAPDVRNAINASFTEISDAVENSARLLGVSSSNAIMSSISQAAENFGRNQTAEEAQAALTVFMDNIARQSYQALYERLGPELQAAIDDSVDLADGSIDGIRAMFSEIDIVAGGLVPTLEAMGISLGSTSDIATANGLALSESMGGAGNALEQFTKLADQFAPAGYQASIALGKAQESVDQWNREIGSNTMAIIDTTESLYHYIKGLDPLADNYEELATAAIEQYDNLVLLEAEQQRQIASLQAVADATGKLGISFDRAGPLAIKASDALVQLMGGIDSFESATDSYYQAYYDESERAQLSLMQSAAAVQVFNEGVIAAGGSAITSKEQFREYVEGLDLTTASGALAFAQAMAVAGSFDAVASSGQTVKEIYDQLPDDLKATFDQMLLDAGLTADALATKAGAIYSTIDGIGNSLSLMDLMFLEMNGTLISVNAETGEALYQLGGSFYSVSTAANGSATVIRTAAGDISGALGGIAASLRGFVGDAYSASSGISSAANSIRASSSSNSASNSATGYASGLYQVPYDDFNANLHKGEMVLTSSMSDRLRSMGFTENSMPSSFGSANEPSFSAPITGSRTSNDGAVLQELQAMRKEIEQLRSEAGSTGSATINTLGAIASGTDQQTTELKTANRVNDQIKRQLTKAIA